MQFALVKRQPKRRCRIPRRPHPDLDYFFGRLERSEGEMRDDTGHFRCRYGIRSLS